MSDVIISRRGSKRGSGGGRMVTEYLCFNQNWVVPNNIKDNQLKVTIIGAGGTGNNNRYYAGGSGNFNNGTFDVTPGEIIHVTIGAPTVITSSNSDPSNGGTTSFGTYLSATGGSGHGSGGASGAGWSLGGTDATWFGGCTGQYGGGGGGPYGGGGCSGHANYSGGSGGIYGGGGGGVSTGSSNSWSARKTCGGNGGTYGGGGGVGSSSNGECVPGVGGTYGGNGGAGVWWNPSKRAYLRTTNATDGTNTIGWTNVQNGDIGEDLRGHGKAGVYISGNGAAGGGGFGGNGGGCVNSSYGGGGGGYGSNGGNAETGGPGGGGGYGGDGGDNHGGGGGYGKISKGGSSSWYAGGGGGYYCPAGGYRSSNLGIDLAMCGGGIGILENNSLIASFGSGGLFPWAGEPGICIIQYYI